MTSGASGAGLAFGKSVHGPSGAVSLLPSEFALPFLLLQVEALEGGLSSLRWGRWGHLAWCLTLGHRASSLSPG